MVPTNTPIATGLSIDSQVPLNTKEYFILESVLIDLGINDEYAYTYYKGMSAYCAETNKKYRWKEIEEGEIGLRNTNFIYPDGWIQEGIDYSLKEYNFIEDIASLQDLQSVLDVGNFAIIGSLDGTGGTLYDFGIDGFSSRFNKIEENVTTSSNIQHIGPNIEIFSVVTDTDIDESVNGSFSLNQGKVTISQAKTVSSVGSNTVLVFTDPIASTEIRVPAKPEGNYTIATLNDIPTIDGSETKLENGTNTTVVGDGKITTPYKINVTFPDPPDGSETKIINGNGTVIEGNGTNTTPYKVHIPKNNIINTGYFETLNIGTTSTFTLFGDITGAITTLAVTPDHIVRITVANNLPSNYKVDVSLESLNSDINDDNDVAMPVYKKVDTTHFDLSFRELSNNSQALRVHIDVKAY